MTALGSIQTFAAPGPKVSLLGKARQCALVSFLQASTRTTGPFQIVPKIGDLDAARSRMCRATLNVVRIHFAWTPGNRVQTRPNFQESPWQIPVFNSVMQQAQDGMTTVNRDVE